MFNAIVRIPQGCKESSKYKERMMKKLFLMLWGCFFAIVISGCVSGETDLGFPPTIIGDVDYRIAIDVEILDETYHWPWKILWPSRSKAELLYLKIYDKKNPEISLLYPLIDEKEDSGTRKYSLITPFEYGEPTVLVFELLDDDSWSKDEEELFVEAAKTGTLIVCDAARAYKTTNYIAAEEIFWNKDGIASWAHRNAVVLVNDLNWHKNDSLGIYESKLTREGLNSLYNTVTIQNNDSKTKMRGYIKIGYSTYSDWKKGR